MRPAFILILLAACLVAGTVAVFTTGWFYLGFAYGLLLGAAIAYMVSRT